MTEKEREKLERLAKIIPMLNTAKKERTLGLIEGAAFMASILESRDENRVQRAEF